MVQGPKKVEITDMTVEEREYYVTTWGFDPVAEKKVPQLLNDERNKSNLPPLVYYYEAPIPLENDPALQATGVTVFARVEVDEDDANNRVIFKRGAREMTVYCVHTAVYAGTMQNLDRLPDDKLQGMVTSTELAPVSLPPWEHFVALKSYVAGIASVGFLELYRGSYQQDELEEATNRHSLNMTMPAQINEVLLGIAPEVVQPIFFEIFGNLLERVPAKWLSDRWEFFAQTGGWDAMSNNDFLDSLDFSARLKLVDIYLSQYEEWGAMSGSGHLDAEVLPVLLSEELITKLEPLLLRKISALFFHISSFYYNQSDLGKLLYKIFMQSIRREDESILTMSFMHDLDFALETFGFQYVPIKVSEQVSPQYMRKLAGGPLLIRNFVLI